ncbi:hypothetical protein [Dictyobacter arantiisoli]|uniref:Uncharacterized protein n=1 Tax=Dictyobacter arantiisoli TaxID=2014874 RepID=A0A5A5T6E6_9CHLR|nr:hypothetical protein [Dictyobacter arantiisoli]GCF06756.1 hypothetical protein KDI_03200 [Dictyobacter arantiisoli]
MSLTSKQSQQPRGLRRLWRVPTSPARWFWLGGSALLYVALLIWYYYALRVQAYPGPLTDPLRLFGIIAFVLVLTTAGYSLRRRFVRQLPGKVQDWLWMHIWFGMITILIALLHDNYGRITNDFCQNLACLTDTYWATSALFALIFLVVSGIIGRLFDFWQTRVIAREASSNGVGIERAVEERLRELEYTIERYCAGKSDDFKRICMQTVKGHGASFAEPEQMVESERADWQSVQSSLQDHILLSRSLHRQRRARHLIRNWRVVHVTLACLSLLVISYHGIMELLTNVLHF